MHNQSQKDAFKRLNLILGQNTVQKLKQLTVLVVGVGGIGCQVLKNISKHPLKKVVIIDLDIIEISNLNRQFYFRKQHLMQSKSKIARQQILKLNPEFNIEAIEGNIYDKKFDNYQFYNEFDVVISALDNMKARQHLAKNCTKYGKVLIDAGTSGFNGQSYSSIKFLTSCHNCYPSVQQQNFAVCTIRSRPQRSIHCAIYAKNLYEQFFGEEKDDYLQSQLKAIKQKIVYCNQELNQELIKKIGIDLFDFLFCKQLKFNHESQNQNYIQIDCLLYKKTIKLNQPLQPNRYNINDKQDSIWSLNSYAEAFLNSFCKLVKRKINADYLKPPLIYDKDDQDCSVFVYCVSNLRIFNFKNSTQNNKLKYLTFQECRAIIGKIIPAIASTNSIAAALQTKQIIDLFTGNLLPPKFFTISPFIHQKISYSWLSLPNPDCQICSPSNIYFQVACSLGQRTFEEFQQFSKQNCFSYDRDLYCSDLILIKNLNANKISPNKNKFLNFKSDLVIQNTLTLNYKPTSKISDLKVQITLIDNESFNLNEQKFKILNKKQITKTLEALESQKKSSCDLVSQKKHLSVDESQQEEIEIL